MVLLSLQRLLIQLLRGVTRLYVGSRKGLVVGNKMDIELLSAKKKRDTPYLWHNRWNVSRIIIIVVVKVFGVQFALLFTPKISNAVRNGQMGGCVAERHHVDKLHSRTDVD